MARTEIERQLQKNKYLRDRNASNNDVAPLPACLNPERRASCRLNFRLFCTTYFPAVFDKPFSQDHLAVIASIEEAVLRGGQMSVAMPRGSGKTTLCEIAAIWAKLYGHRKYVVIVGATGKLASKNLTKIKAHLETNRLLAEDFPEVCHPISKLARTPQKALSQTHQGEPTFIEWKTDHIVLPTIPGSEASGAYIDVVGITGSIRGRGAVHPATGKIIRPDLVIVDDFQTKASARSAPQCELRLSAINSDIMGLGTDRNPIAAFATVTVIYPNDAADHLLNRKLFPQWRGRRTRMLRSLPTNHKLWEEYSELWAACLRRDDNGGDISEATDFYRANQSAMDEGADASWPENYEEREASAIQHAMNKKLKDEQAFWSECQNEPISNRSSNIIQVTADQLVAKVVDYQPGFVPDGTIKLTAMIDIQGSILFWTVCAWGQGFRGHVVDRGCWPEQDRIYFGLSDLTATFQSKFPTSDLDGQIYSALEECVGSLLTRKFYGSEEDKPYEIDRLLIDDNWGPSTQTVRLFVKQSAHRKRIITSQGVGVTAKKRPFAEYRAEDGVKLGLNWHHYIKDNRLRFDANFWKTFVVGRLQASKGETGSITIFRPEKDGQLRLLFEHLSSEYARPITDGATNRTVHEWELLPNRENHWFDCLIGCAVAASEQGIVTATVAANKPVMKKRRALALHW